MAENKNEKKKTNTTTKKVNKKTNTTTKKKTTSKPASKSNTTRSNSKTTQVKKTQAKKGTSTKKQTAQTKVTKQVPKKEINKPQQQPTKKPQVKEISKEEQLEKTLIFDGRENKNLVEVVEKLEEKNVVLEDKVIKRSKAKKIIIIILTILIFVIIAATACYAIRDELIKIENNQTLNSNIYKKVVKKYKTIGEINKQEKKDKEEKEEAATTIEELEYSNIETISLAEFERKILEKEDMTVFIASSTCYPCLEFEPIINEVYKEKNSKIYKINISYLSESEITRFRTYYAFKVTPTIFTIKEGIATAESTGALTKEELIDWLDKNV